MDAPSHTTSIAVVIGLVTNIALGWSIIVSCLRFAGRVQFTGPFGVDDAALLAAQMLSILQAAAVDVASLSGYDGHGDTGRQHFEKGLYAGQLLYITCLYASKCSIVLLFARTSSSDKHQKFCRWNLIALTVWAVFATVVVAIRGDLNSPWTALFGTGLLWRWTIIEVGDALTEFTIYGIAISLVWGLNSRRWKKGLALSLCGSRLLLVPVAAARLAYLSTFDFRSAAIATILQQAILHWSIISASIPTMKPLFNPYVMMLVDVDDQGNTVQPRIGFLHLTIPPEQVERQKVQAEKQRMKTLSRSMSATSESRSFHRRMSSWWDERSVRQQSRDGSVLRTNTTELSFDGVPPQSSGQRTISKAMPSSASRGMTDDIGLAR